MRNRYTLRRHRKSFATRAFEVFALINFLVVGFAFCVAAGLVFGGFA
jgi:hypothetical protein